MTREGHPVFSLVYINTKRVKIGLQVLNILGQHIATLIDAEQAVGNYQALLDVKELSSGMYFGVLKSNGERQIRKMVLMK